MQLLWVHMGNFPGVQHKASFLPVFWEVVIYLALFKAGPYSSMHDSMALGIGRCWHHQPSRARQFSFFRYDVELFQRIEHLIGKKLPVFPTQDEEVMMLTERVNEAQRFARMVRVSAFPSFWCSDLCPHLYPCILFQNRHGQTKVEGSWEIHHWVWVGVVWLGWPHSPVVVPSPNKGQSQGQKASCG